MTIFTAGVEVRQRKPQVDVENILDPGAWVFRLVVVDEDGNESAPQSLTILVNKRNVVPPPVVGPGRPPFRPGTVIDPTILVATPVTPVEPQVTVPIRPTRPAVVEPAQPDTGFIVTEPAPVRPRVTPGVRPGLDPRIFIRRPG